jgi:hypothetical protein
MRSESKLQVLSRSTKQFRRRQESQEFISEHTSSLEAERGFEIPVEFRNSRQEGREEIGIVRTLYGVSPSMKLLKLSAHLKVSDQLKQSREPWC